MTIPVAQPMITAEPRETVQAGTVVRFRVATVEGQDRAALDQQSEFVWHVVGPFSSDEQIVHGASLFDFDTTGKAPGAYTVFTDQIARQPDTPPPADPAGEAGEVPEQPGDVMASSVRAGSRVLEARAAVPGPAGRSNRWITVVQGPGPVNRDGIVPVSLQRTQVVDTPDQVLWTVIRNRTEAISFRPYRQFIDSVMCRAVDIRNNPQGTGGTLRFTGTQAFDVLKQATEAFLMQECGVVDANSGFVQPVGFLDPRLTIEDLSVDSAPFLEEEARRYGQGTGAITATRLEALRGKYYEDLNGENASMLPYLRLIRERLSDLPLKSPDETNGNCYGILRSHLTGPVAIELIWNYWLDEGMLAQTLNAILARFQNRSSTNGTPDPLLRFNLDPLRPLANIFWGWAEDEYHRLSVRRRAAEYGMQYGLTLVGKAVLPQQLADNRTTFLESWHTLLNCCYLFFKEDDDTTVIADGFPLLNALRETHLILAEGAHNQFGDLPSAARAQFMIMQWLLARPEMREFLGGKTMVPTAEAWMDRVDTMKQIQGWTDTSVTHFRDLAVFGEQLLLSVRYGNWSVVNDPQQAANWARYWRPELQRFTHAYRATTGVDLTHRVNATMPSRLLQHRLAERRQTVP